MKSFSLTNLARRHLVDADRFAREFPHPWFVWCPPEEVGEDKILATNASEVGSTDFMSGPPVAIAVIKAEPNAFPFGITLGHAENNDVVISHHQVSRFHAYLKNERGQFFLVDADSKNGTFLDGQRVLPSKPVALPSRALVRLGEVRLRYFEPAAFAAWLDSQSEG